MVIINNSCRCLIIKSPFLADSTTSFGLFTGAPTDQQPERPGAVVPFAIQGIGLGENLRKKPWFKNHHFSGLPKNYELTP